MANAALFVGWDHAIAGRDQKALQVFSETTKFYAQLQQRGEIEIFPRQSISSLMVETSTASS